ncbi:DUF3347 domain-containing protein [uncultured Maribacter sp.]|uniref:DUF3347 domain-containing protein n=1 Tax=uncultured Maribacter sp. TaxID=431308 RepID=UPI0030DC8510|tara:strand:+ start:6118 stop:6762 length:645 start_codon:yes stop_codon:yes gene_type:complete
MRKLNISTGILAMTVAVLSATSCKNIQKDANTEDGHQSEYMDDNGHMDDEMEGHLKMDQDNMQSSESMMSTDQYSMMSSQIIGDYLKLKDALVADDKDAAAKAGVRMVSALKDFNVGSFPTAQHEELKDFIENVKEHAEHIGESDIKHQREHFKLLSKDVTDMVAIIGTEIKLYEQFCPMYDGGTAWLSTKEEIRNPYYGSKMLTCGKVNREIN